MSLNIVNPRIYTNSQGQAWPGVSDVAHGSYVTDGHTAPSGKIETINEDIELDRVPVVAANVLARAGWDGTTLTPSEKQDLCRFADHNGHSFAFNIHDAYEQFWHERGELGGVTPPPAPTPPGNQGSTLYPSFHEVSATWPKGTRGWRAIGAFETVWGAINAMILQAGEGGEDASGAIIIGDGVPTFEDELQAARQGLLNFYYQIVAAAEEDRDFILPTEAESCQLAADQVWNTFHACRKQWMAAKATGWVLVVNDPRATTFIYSRLNRIAWDGLANLTTACGLYQLRGEKKASGVRDAYYVDPFMNFESQDPLRTQVGGGGGIGIGGGQSFLSAIKP